ncbi:glycosyltransferase, partial [Acidithiobacillus ferrooxidans]|nr:glycosyltransferase [Acidithiobacillus ferrooxidans]
MRIVIDLQGAQTPGSRNRGIGRYSLSLALAIARQGGEHEILIMLNGAFPDTIDPIRQAFNGLIPTDNFRILYGLYPSRAIDADNRWRRQASEKLYESFMLQIDPDILLVSSLFEGFHEDAITSVNSQGKYAVAVILYDLILLIHPKPYLENPSVSAWYHARLDHLRRADILLAISESSRQEAIKYLDVEDGQAVNISCSIDGYYRPLSFSLEERRHIMERYYLTRPFVMYTGGIDYRKNIEALISAYAKLSNEIRRGHQLAIVCSILDHDRNRLEKLAQKCGLGAGELVFTGFIPSDDLLALYNLCRLFVFPSWHEGFGLPVLEAMACGAPTLASNCSSLPEVVGLDEALFDPKDEHAIVDAMERALTNDAFLQRLKAHGLQQAKKFSWDASAQRALQAMETRVSMAKSSRAATPPLAKIPRKRLRLAYVSPLPPAQTGIADYSAELLPELSRYYVIDVIVAQQEPVTDPWVLANAAQRMAAWFDQHAGEYDRILYQFGNSQFHQHMFGLLEKHPGVVVLHDFFLSGALVHMDLHGIMPGIWAQALQRSHGWQAVCERYSETDTAAVIFRYPCNLDVLQRAQGVICHSDFSRRLAMQWYGPGWADDWALVPLLRVPVVDNRRQEARDELGLDDRDVLVCSFGLMGKSKLNHRLLEAWQASSLAKDKRCKLVFIGFLPMDDYGEQIRQVLKAPGLRGRVHVTGWADAATYRRYLAAADLAVQLRTLSRGETSGTALDCMNHSVATIVNANGSMTDLPADVVHVLPDEFSTQHLVDALDFLRKNKPARQALGQRAAQHVRAYHNPRRCADQYAQAIEEFYLRAESGASGIIKAVRQLGMPENVQDITQVAERSVQLFPPPRPAQKQLLVDVSSLVQGGVDSEWDYGATRLVLQELLNHPPPDLRVEPVYITAEHGYRYARRATMRFLGYPDGDLQDDVMEVWPGDVFFGLDFQLEMVPMQAKFFEEIRYRGAQVFFLCYDLLPCMAPQYFLPDRSAAHFRWLQTIAITDGVICTSRAVADQFSHWLDLFGPERSTPLHLGWAHIGFEVIQKMKELDTAYRYRHVLDKVRARPSFLSVTTLEPSKQLGQVLTAFDLLWRQGMDVNLVLVGKYRSEGENMVARLQTHPERESRLFWLQDISGDRLDHMYAASACLIAASVDESFGLTLIEAAQHKLPILARDTPVFREMAGEYADYFSGDAPQHLAEAIRHWLQAHKSGSGTQAHLIVPRLTQQKSTQNLMEVMLGGNWYRQWFRQTDPRLVARYWGSDWRLGSAVGEICGTSRQSKGVAGYLLHGPYISLKPGRYVATIHGTHGFGGPAGARADVVIKGGTMKIAEEVILACDYVEAKQQPLVTLPFILADGCSDLEVRVHVEQESDIQVTMLELHKQDGAVQIATSQNNATTEMPFASSIGTDFTSPTAVVYRYWATHPCLSSQVGQKVGRTLWTLGKAGVLVHGPYISLPAGTYRAAVFGQVNRPGSLDGAWMDATAQKGELQLVKTTLGTNAQCPALLGEITFSLNRYTKDVEVRVWVDTGSDLHVTGIQIEQIPDEACATEPATKGGPDGADIRPVKQVTDVRAPVMEIHKLDVVSPLTTLQCSYMDASMCARGLR